LLFNMRISLPDTPGSLGALATALGEGGANILTLDVVDKEDGYAVDDLSVEAPQGLEKALKTVSEQIPGALVEDVRPIDTFRDILAPIEMAGVLAETQPASVTSVLVRYLPDALWAGWCALIQDGGEYGNVIEQSIDCPDLSELQTPWLPLLGARRLAPGRWMPSRWTMGATAQPGIGTPELAAAPFGPDGTTIVIGRQAGPRFRTSEVKQLGFLAKMATAVLAPKPAAIRAEI